MNLDNKFVKMFVFLKEFIAAIVFYFALLNVPFSDPVLEVTYSDSKYVVPHKIDIQLTENTEEDKDELYGLISTFFDGAILRTYKFSNNSSSQIKDVEIKLHNVVSVNGVYVDSTSAKNLGKLSEYAIYKDMGGGELFFGGIDNISPKTTLTIGVYGRFSHDLFQRPVSIVSSSPETSISELRKASGIALIIFDHLYELFFLVLFVSFLVGAKRFHRE